MLQTENWHLTHFCFVFSDHIFSVLLLKWYKDNSYCHVDFKTVYFVETDFAENIQNGWKAGLSKWAIEKRTYRHDNKWPASFNISRKVAVSSREKILQFIYIDGISD